MRSVIHDDYQKREVLHLSRNYVEASFLVSSSHVRLSFLFFSFVFFFFF